MIVVYDLSRGPLNDRVNGDRAAYESNAARNNFGQRSLWR
jgi:hypothetical protein